MKVLHRLKFGSRAPNHSLLTTDIKPSTERDDGTFTMTFRFLLELIRLHLVDDDVEEVMESDEQLRQCQSERVQEEYTFD